MNAFNPRNLSLQPQGQPQAFGTSASLPSGQPASNDPVGTAVGTFLEDFVSGATFGLVHPDIVPQAQEEANPWAATVGRVAGSVAGFLPSFGVSGVAAKTILGGFNFGRKVLAAGEASGALANISQAARPFKSSLTSLGESTLTWAIDSTAREFVRQAEQDDFDGVQLWKKGMSGALSGLFQSQVSLATHASHWGIQAVSTGTAIATSEAISDAADGADIFSVEYMTKRMPATFLQGAALGMWNSRGWKDRHEAAKLFGSTQWKELENSLRNDDPLTVWDNWKSPMQIIQEYSGKNQRMMPPEMVEAAKKLDKWDIRPTKNLRTMQGRVKAVQKSLGLDDETYRGMLADYTGKTSTTQFAKEDYDATFKGFRDYVNSYRDTVKTKSIGPLEEHASPVDRVLTMSGLKDLAQNTYVAKALLTKERESFMVFRNAAKTEWEDQWKIVGGEKGNTPDGVSKSSADLYRRIQQRDPNGLNTKQRKVYDEYLSVQTNYHQRLNEVELAMGKKDPNDPDFDPKKDVPITNSLDNYIRHTIDRGAMIRAGRAEELPPGAGELDFATIRPFSAKRQESTQKKFSGQFIYKQDPWQALDSMVHNDLKVIWLHQPTAILKQQMKMAVSAGTLPDSAAQYMNKYVRHVLYEQPTTATQAANRQAEKMLSTDFGKWVVKKAADMHVDFGENPINGLANIWGQSVSRSLIGFSVKQAFRNSTQFLYSFGMNDVPSVAKALRGKGYNAVIDDGLEKSLYRQNAVGSGGADDMSTTTQGRFDKMAFGLFQSGAQKSVDVSMRSAGYQTIEYITNPKYASLKGKDGKTWFDAEGVALRKENPNALSKGEVERIHKQMDFEGMHTNFAYNAMGLPMIYRSGVARPFFKLVSYPMQYTYQYIGELVHRAKTGTTGNGMPLPTTARLGIAKHLVGLGMAVSALQATTGLDYSSILGISYNPNNEGGMTVLNRNNIFAQRPSPGMAVLLNVTNLFSPDGYTRLKAQRDLASLPTILVPGSGTMRQIGKATREGDVTGVMLYKVKEPKPKRIGRVAFGSREMSAPSMPSPFGTPFSKPFGG